MKATVLVNVMLIGAVALIGCARNHSNETTVYANATIDCRLNSPNIGVSTTSTRDYVAGATWTYSATSLDENGEIPTQNLGSSYVGLYLGWKSRGKNLTADVTETRRGFDDDAIPGEISLYNTVCIEAPLNESRKALPRRSSDTV